MKLNFNKALTDLDGNDIPNSNMGKLVAQILTQGSTGDAVKFWELALKLHKGEVIDIDTTDQNALKEFIRGSQNLANLAKAQLLLVFEKSK